MSELALLGGPMAVTRPPQERWVQVNADVKAAVLALMDQGVVSIGGPTGVVGEFEAAFAAMTGSRHALAMNSGTATLHSAYFAVGIGPGDEVLVPAYTWHASATPIIHCAATPVFCDIRPESLTLDPDDVERRITARTKALCVVHVFGNVCDMDRLCDIARRHDLALIEDASHAHGALWRGQLVQEIHKFGFLFAADEQIIRAGFQFIRHFGDFIEQNFTRRFHKKFPRNDAKAQSGFSRARLVSLRLCVRILSFILFQ